MWNRVKAFCLYSATIGWSYVLAIVGALLQIADAIPDISGDPFIRESITNAVGGDPKLVGKIMLGISIVNIIARMRSLRKIGGSNGTGT